MTGKVEAAAFKFPNSQYRIAIEAENRSDEDKLFTFIEKACEADPTMSIDRDEETAQTVISAVGEAQVSVLLIGLEVRTKVAAHIVTPSTASPSRPRTAPMRTSCSPSSRRPARPTRP